MTKEKVVEEGPEERVVERGVERYRILKHKLPWRTVICETRDEALERYNELMDKDAYEEAFELAAGHSRLGKDEVSEAVGKLIGSKEYFQKIGDYLFG